MIFLSISRSCLKILLRCFQICLTLFHFRWLLFDLDGWYYTSKWRFVNIFFFQTVITLHQKGAIPIWSIQNNSSYLHLQYSVLCFNFNALIPPQKMFWCSGNWRNETKVGFDIHFPRYEYNYHDVLTTNHKAKNLKNNVATSKYILMDLVWSYGGSKTPLCQNSLLTIWPKTIVRLICKFTILKYVEKYI